MEIAEAHMKVYNELEENVGGLFSLSLNLTNKHKKQVIPT